jgi:hypothetical protein
MFSPTTFWADVAPNGPVWDALFYGWILYAIQAVLAAPLSLASNGAILSQWAERSSNDPNSPFARLAEQFAQNQSGPIAILLITLGIVILFPVSLIIGSAILHVFALLFGAGKNGYWATMRVVAYALSPTLFSFVPCVSALASIYVMVLIIFGLASVHETTQGKAAAAALTPVGLSICCCCAGLALAAGGVASALGNVH